MSTDQPPLPARIAPAPRRSLDPRIPLRNACLHFRNRVSAGNPVTELMRRYGINVVLDVGANVGQYARGLLRSGYRGRIVSFEPLPDAFERLRTSRWGFPNWTVEPFAIGAADTTSVLHVAGNSVSSSLQEMLPGHWSAAPESAYIGSCPVTVRRLEGIFGRYVRPGDRCYMKLDVQGHEQHVLAGAEGCLDQITAVQMELSMEHLYAGQWGWRESIEAMESRGFQLRSMDPGFRDRRTGAMLQADGIFVRRAAVEALKAAA